MKHESAVIVDSPLESLQARSELFNLMKNYPGTPEEIECVHDWDILSEMIIMYRYGYATA